MLPFAMCRHGGWENSNSDELLTPSINFAAISGSCFIHKRDEGKWYVNEKLKRKRSVWEETWRARNLFDRSNDFLSGSFVPLATPRREFALLRRWALNLAGNSMTLTWEALDTLVDKWNIKRPFVASLMLNCTCRENRRSLLRRTRFLLQP